MNGPTNKRPRNMEDSSTLSTKGEPSIPNRIRMDTTPIRPLDPKLHLLSLPAELIEYTNKIIAKENFNSKIKFLEEDLIFWMHDLDIDYNWLREASIQEFIDYPHPFRNMKIPLFRRTVRFNPPCNISGFTFWTIQPSNT